MAYSGGAGSSSVAVGLHDVLGVGELVELIDVGLGNHDVDGREHVWAPRGIVFNGVSLFDEAGVRPAILVRGACNAGGVGAILRVQTRKAPGELGSCVRRLMVIVYPSKFEYSTVRTVSCIAAETQQPQRKVAVCTDFTTSQISAHNSRCGGCRALWEYMWAGVCTLWDNMVQSA